MVVSRKLIPDGGGGTLEVVEEEQVLCDSCGYETARRLMSYVHSGTKRPDLVRLGIGASVKHYWTVCAQCKAASAS